MKVAYGEKGAASHTKIPSRQNATSLLTSCILFCGVRFRLEGDNRAQSPRSERQGCSRSLIRNTCSRSHRGQRGDGFTQRGRGFTQRGGGFTQRGDGFTQRGGGASLRTASRCDSKSSMILSVTAGTRASVTPWTVPQRRASSLRAPSPRLWNYWGLGGGMCTGAI
jgi:hypothetical protein